MNHSEAVEKWRWKNYIETGMKKWECVAWAKKYCKERGFPIKSFGWSAISGWTWVPFSGKWKRISKTKMNYPPEWALVFWSEDRCKYGHVAVASKFCNPALLRCTDQNGTGKGDPIQPRWYTYSSVLGWWVYDL